MERFKTSILAFRSLTSLWFPPFSVYRRGGWFLPKSAKWFYLYIYLTLLSMAPLWITCHMEYVQWIQYRRTFGKSRSAIYPVLLGMCGTVFWAYVKYQWFPCWWPVHRGEIIWLVLIPLLSLGMFLYHLWKKDKTKLN